MSDTTAPLFDNVSIPLPTAPASFSLKPISIRLASTSLPFDTNPPFYFFHYHFLSKLETYV